MAIAERSVVVAEWLSGPGFGREEIVAIAERSVIVAEWLSTRALQTVVVVVGAVCGPLEGKSGDRAARVVGRGLRVIGSSLTVVVQVGVTARGGIGTPARLCRLKTHEVQFLLGVCVCVSVSVGPVCK